MALKHISECPLTPYGKFYYRTDDPDIIAEIEVYRKDLRISEVKNKIKNSDALVIKPVAQAPVNASQEVNEAVVLLNMHFEPDREMVRAEKAEASRLKLWLNNVGVEVDGR